MENRFHLLYHRKIIKNQNGFSLVEIIAVVAIAAIVVMGNSIFMSDFIKRMNAYSNESMEEGELAVLNTMALNILKKSSLSFNRLTLADDDGVNFFDFYPDMPFGSFTAETRTFTLDRTAKYFYIMSSDESRSSSTVFDPVHAYNVLEPSPVDGLTDGTTSYRGVNSVPDFTGESGAAASVKMMSQIFGARWSNNNIFVVTCPTYLRPIVSGIPAVSLATAPRMPTYTGKVVGDDLVLLASSDVGVAINNTHPVTSAAYTSLDNYFRTLPTVGGAAPFVKIEPAVVSRFELRASTPPVAGLFDVYMMNFRAGAYTDEIKVAMKVKTITFTRKSITLPIISMEIQK